jgi:hypothetical protein
MGSDGNLLRVGLENGGIEGEPELAWRGSEVNVT